MLVGAIATSLDGAHLIFERALGGRLELHVERRVDLESLLVQLPPELVVEQLAHPFDEVGRELASVGLLRESKRIGAGEAGIGVANLTLTPHQLDDGVAPLDDAIGKPARVVAAGALWNRRERRRLGQIEVANGFAEVALGCAFDAIGPVAEVDLIEVELENPVLRVLRLDGTRDLRLLELADR